MASDINFMEHIADQAGLGRARLQGQQQGRSHS